MPTIASTVVPPPKSWDEFEDITLAASKLRWDSDAFSRNGRQGQKQSGVDIWGYYDDRMIGVQCKNSLECISLEIVKSEVVNAERFVPKLNHLYIATTAKRDAPLQTKTRELSKERHQRHAFRVDILFWEDICQELAKDDRVFFAHYPQFRSHKDPAREHDQSLFDTLTALLNSAGVIGFLERTNMAGFPYRSDDINPLREFYYEWERPEREFINPALERIRKALWNKADEYLEITAAQTFPCKNPDLHVVPPEWEYQQPDRFRETVDSLHRLAREIVALHGDLVRTGRAILMGSKPKA